MGEDIISSGVSDGEILENTPEIEEAEETKEKQARQEFEELKMLARSPAWQRLRKTFDQRVEAAEKFDMVDFSAEDRIVGEQCKVHKLVAGELKKFMMQIDGAIEAGEEQDDSAE